MDIYLKTVGDEYFLSAQHLIGSGMNQRTLNNYISKFNKGKSKTFDSYKDKHTMEKWVVLKSIPRKILQKLNIPISPENADKFLEKLNQKELKGRYRSIWFVLFHAWSETTMWKQYIPYYLDSYQDIEKRRLFAKTHAVFNEIFLLKKSYLMTEIHMMYLKLNRAVFWTENYISFCRKINKAQTEGIPETLVHDFKRLGRSRYKLSKFARRRLKFHYSIPKPYTFKKIHQKVNDELIEEGFPIISYSAVVKFLSLPKVKNQCDLLRYGEKNARQHLFPYIIRKEPMYIGEALQIDSTTLNLFSLDENNDRIRLTLCVVMDVYSRKIVGHSLAVSENSNMILEAIMDAFQSFRYIPREILFDNHKAYFSKDFALFKDYLEEYGVNLRTARIGNAKDKGHVERWFRTFQYKYLVDVIGSYGAGIKSKKIGDRISKELEQLYLKKGNIRDISKTKTMIKQLINSYNVDIKKSIQERVGEEAQKIKPKKFTDEDIAKFFFKSKTLKIRRSMLRIHLEGIKYEYTIKNRALFEKTNNTKVLVKYDTNDMSMVYLFDEETGEFLSKLVQDYAINLVATKKDLGVIKAHTIMIKNRIKEQTDELLDEFEKGRAELTSLPVQMHNSPNSLKKLLSLVEDESLIAHMLPKEEKSGSKKLKQNYEKLKKDASNMYLKRNRRGKLKIIKRKNG